MSVIFNKPSIIPCETEEAFKVFLGVRLWPLQNSVNFLRVGFDSIARYVMPKIFYLGNAKATFADFSIEVVVSHGLHHFLYMCDVRLQVRAIYQDVIEKYKDKLSKVLLKHKVHETLESGGSVC